MMLKATALRQARLAVVALELPKRLPASAWALHPSTTATSSETEGAPKRVSLTASESSPKSRDGEKPLRKPSRARQSKRSASRPWQSKHPLPSASTLSPQARKFLNILNPRPPRTSFPRKSTSRKPPVFRSTSPAPVTTAEGWVSEKWTGESWKEDLTPSKPEVTRPVKERRFKADKTHRRRSSLDGESKSKNSWDSSTVMSNKTAEKTIENLAPKFPKHRVHGTLQPLDRPVLSDVALGERPRIAELAHGLDRVLFNPGVHWLQDPRSRVYNFTPWLQTVPKVSEFDFDRIPGFVPSSRDGSLRTLAKDQNRRFAGSTSSLSGLLAHCYYLISENKEVDTSILSQHFKPGTVNFSPAQRWPTRVIMNYKDGIYTIDSGKFGIDPEEKNILTWLGTLLEKFLTTPSEEFSKLLKSSAISEESIVSLQSAREAYRYSKSNDFVMRSQLDCYDPRLPGTGVFDIKTRACMPTRLDILNYEEHQGYSIKKLHGELESFEKEYYDLLRSAFLKYSFQVRIGNMDGVIVAYHNTETIFGFQYIPLSEMDERLFGPGEGVGDRVFEKCVGLLEKVMNEVAGCFGNQSCRATFLAPERGEALMNVWVEPLEWTGEEGDRPIEQISVKLESYLGQGCVSGDYAVSNSTPDRPWTLEYQIEHLSVKPEEARKQLNAAQEEALRSFVIPTGVEFEGLEEYWKTVAHGNGKEMSVFDPSIFTSPRGFIQSLRELSRKGREETEALQDRYRDERKIVLGAPVE